jgi:hypothetical protein
MSALGLGRVKTLGRVQIGCPHVWAICAFLTPDYALIAAISG